MKHLFVLFFAFFITVSLYPRQKENVSVKDGKKTPLIIRVADKTYQVARQDFSSILSWDAARAECSKYKEGDKNDWFLPSKEELNAMHKQLYQEGTGSFVPLNYWSSSEHTIHTAWHQIFNSGEQRHNYGKGDRNYARCIRIAD
jgi:hypothetical protein